MPKDDLTPTEAAIQDTGYVESEAAGFVVVQSRHGVAVVIAADDTDSAKNDAVKILEALATDPGADGEQAYVVMHAQGGTFVRATSLERAERT